MGGNALHQHSPVGLQKKGAPQRKQLNSGMGVCRSIQGMRKALLFLALTSVAASAEEFDNRLAATTIVREDLFAGYLTNDDARFAIGEKNLALLRQQRPGDLASITAWEGANTLYRAVRAYEQQRPSAEVDKLYREAMAQFAEAARLGPNEGGVMAVTGGMMAVVGDRLPPQYRAEVWAKSWTAYQALYKAQAQSVSRLPLHLQGELLAGLAQSAQRTGRQEELNTYLEKIVTVMPESPYARIAKKWQADPALAAKSSITCQTCHEPGRLAAKQAALVKSPAQ